MSVRALLVVVAAALLPAPALAAPPTIAAHANVTRGAAPLAVTMQATGDAVSYRWSLGDGATAEGATVRHVYTRPGLYRAVVTGVSASGEPARAEAAVAALEVRLDAPAPAPAGALAAVTGSVRPALLAPVKLLDSDGRIVATATTGADGRFTATTKAARPQTLRVRIAGVQSASQRLLLRPRLEAELVGSPVVGEPLQLVARAVPSAAGRLLVRVRRGGRVVASGTYGSPARIALDTRAAGRLTVEARLAAADGYVAVPARRLTATLSLPVLTYGSRGSSVLRLERRLASLRYALPRPDGVYDRQTAEAVLAFQKVEGLPWTGRVDTAVWRRLDRARASVPRFAGTHIEVSKGRQYLLAVERSRVTAVLHVSTGATGNTPLGTWRIYRKVTGWDWVLWYPMYFLRGFAVHGYPEVPAYPASHGCVRVPMWFAPRLYASFAYGRAVHIYS